MRRKTLDLLLNWVGVLLTAVFLVAGMGMLVGYNFTSSQVKSQLVEQKVYFPTKTQSDYRDLVAAHETQFAGQEVLTGSQAQIFANDIIGVDTAAISGGKTYAQISAASMAAPSNTSVSPIKCSSSFAVTPFGGCCSTRTPSVSWASSRSTAQLACSSPR
jgi:hypothetical protein